MVRAQQVIQSRDALWVNEAMQPQGWPEVQRAAGAYAKATGRPGDAALGSYGRDAGTRAIVELFAAGHMPSIVYAGLARVVASDWYQGGKYGLSSITPEVFRRDGLEAHAAPLETRLRAPETSFRSGPVEPPPPEVTAALDGLARAHGGKAGLAVARRAREAT